MSSKYCATYYTNFQVEISNDKTICTFTVSSGNGGEGEPRADLNRWKMLQSIRKIKILYIRACTKWPNHWASIFSKVAEMVEKGFPGGEPRSPLPVLWLPEDQKGENSLQISLKFAPKFRINDIPGLVQIMARRRPGDKPLSEPMVFSLPTHICITRPQWVWNLFSWRKVIPQVIPWLLMICRGQVNRLSAAMILIEFSRIFHFHH